MAGSPVCIPVGSRYTSVWLVVPAVVAVGLSLVAAVAYFFDGERAGVILGLALVPLGVAACSFLFLRQSRKILEIFDDGFRIREITNVREYRDDEVLGITLSATTCAAPLFPYWGRRAVTLRLAKDAGEECVPLRASEKLGKHGPFSEFVERLQAGLLERSLIALQRKNGVESTGWTLHPNRLITRSVDQNSLPASTPNIQVAYVGSDQGKSDDNSENGSQSIPLSELSAAEVFDKHLCLWKLGETRPWVRIPETAENTWLLQRLVHSCAAMDALAEEPSPETGLGRWLFERRPQFTSIRLMLWFFAVGIAIPGCLFVYLFFADKARWGNVTSIVIGCILLLIALALSALAFALNRRVLRFHAAGVCDVRLFSQQELRFDETSEFLWKVTETKSHGLTVGSVVTLALTPIPKNGRSAVVCNFDHDATVPDADLTEIRERIARVVARRLAEKFAAAGEVQWAADIYLTRNAVELRPKSILRRPKPVQQIPYDTITLYQIKDQRLYVWTIYQERAVVNISTSEPNFFPGFELFERMATAQKE